MTVNCLLLPASKGVPTWQSENLGERQMIKSAAQFAKIFERSRPLDEEIGRALAQWARGNDAPRSAAPTPSTNAAPAAPAKPQTSAGVATQQQDELTTDEADAKLAEAAARGTKALQAAWLELSKAHKQTLKLALDRRHKINAIKADAAGA
jgi:hypothetical protein